MFICLLTLLFVFNLHAVDPTPHGTSCERLLQINTRPTRAGTREYNAELTRRLFGPQAHIGIRPRVRNNVNDTMNSGILAVSLSCAALVGGCIGYTISPSVSAWFNSHPESDIGVITTFGAVIGMKTAMLLVSNPSFARKVNTTYEEFMRRFDTQADRFLD